MGVLRIIREKYLGLLALLGVLRLKLEQRLANFEIYTLADGYDAVEETLFHNVYFKPYEIRDADTIIDLGAYIGGFTLYVALHARSGARIIAVEPNPNAYGILLNNIAYLKRLRNDVEILPLNVAVWGSRGLMPLVITSWSENVYLANSERVKGRKNIHVRTVTMNDLLKIARGKIIIKMDVEGAEYEIFKNPRWLSDNRIASLAMEVHGPLATIAKTLRERGFRVGIKYIRYTSSAAKYWLSVKPRWYAALLAPYRYVVSSIVKTPQIRILHATRITRLTA